MLKGLGNIQNHIYYQEFRNIVRKISFLLMFLTGIVWFSSCGKKTPTSSGGNGTPTDTPPSIMWNGPTSIENGAVLDATYTVKDDKNVVDEKVTGSDGYSQESSPMSKTYNGEIKDTINTSAQSITYTISGTDNNSQTTTKKFTVAITQPAATLSLSPTSVQNHTKITEKLTAHDPDGLTKIGIEGYLTKSWDVSGTDASKTYTDSIAVTGALPQTKNITLYAIDTKNDTTKKNLTFTITAAPQKTYTIAAHLTNALNGTKLDSTHVIIDKNGNPITQATTDKSGNATLPVTQDAGAQDTYTLAAHRNGFVDNTTNITVPPDTNETIKLTPEQLEWIGTLQNIAPKDSEKVTLTDLVKTKTGWIKDASIQSHSQGLTIHHASGNTYYLIGDASGTQNIVVAATSGAGRSGTHTFPVTVNQPAAVSIAGSNQQTITQVPDTLDLATIVTSSAPITSSSITGPSQLTIANIGGGKWTITPQTDGTYDFTINGTNNQGGTAQQTYSIQALHAPTITVTVRNDATQKPEESYLIALGRVIKNGKLVTRDSLHSTNGQFTLQVADKDSTTFLAGAMKNSKLFGFERTKTDTHHNQDGSFDIDVVDFLLRDQNGNAKDYTSETQGYLSGDSLYIGGPGAQDPTAFVKMFEQVSGNGTLGFNGESSVYWHNNFHRFAQSQNSVGPDHVYLIKKLYFTNTKDTFTMEQKTIDRAIKIYDTYIKPVMGKYAKDIQIIDSLAYNPSNQPPNVEFIVPRGDLSGIHVGQINTWGTRGPPMAMMETMSSLRSGPPNYDPGGTVMVVASSQELTSALFYESIGDNDNTSNYLQSDIRETAPSDYPTGIDYKVGFMTFDPNFTGPIDKVLGLRLLQ